MIIVCEDFKAFNMLWKRCNSNNCYLFHLLKMPKNRTKHNIVNGTKLNFNVLSSLPLICYLLFTY